MFYLAARPPLANRHVTVAFRRDFSRLSPGNVVGPREDVGGQVGLVRGEEAEGKISHFTQKEAGSSPQNNLLTWIFAYYAGVDSLQI